ncbi:MAG: PAS domain-containing protein [Pseudotabrizicola sp.]|uniref:PAS domain-containing protein n=1 Tax=Pseudotabrizicola sp. TaxID=2939647 RepID=UPI0027175344|nr:PAS domain-containing protein [Pseudotabrizicola sp.]MDO9639892.1 PAS domain-containing protein [Pseudotabrizicola sp.]
MKDALLSAAARQGTASRLWQRDMVLPLAAFVVPLSIMATVAWMNWGPVWASAEADMRRAARSAAEYSERTFEGYMVAVGRANERLRGLTDQEIRDREWELRQDLGRITGELSQSQLSYVIDRNGYPLIVTNIFPAPDASLFDRDYFQVLSGPDAPDMFISQTFVGRFDGNLLFSLARRRSDTGNPPTEDGFDGVVLISVSPGGLADGLERLLPTPTDRMALMRADGYLIGATGGLVKDGEPLPKLQDGSPFYDHVQRGDPTAVHLSTTAIPGTEALVAMHAVGELPLYAISARPKAQIVAAWRATLMPLFGFGLPATLALVLLSLRVVFDQRRLRQRNVTLQRDNALNSDRLVRAKRFGMMGAFEFDLRTGVSRRSPEYMSIHGHDPVPAEEAHEDWAKRVHPDDREQAENEVLRALSDASGDTSYGQTYRIVTKDGETRWIAAWGEIDRDAQGRAVMLRGIHVDVTPLRSTERALAESDARLRLAQEAMGIGAWEWRGHSQPMHCSRKALELFGFDPASGAVRMRDVLARLHRDDRKSMAQALRQMRASGSFQAEVRLQRPAGMEGDGPLWVALRARTVTSRRLGGSRLMGVVYDISDRKRSEELVVLMAHEVEHRAKNALTVVVSLLRSAKADSAEDLAQVMTGRVRALSQTMALLGKQQWTGAALRDIVESELRPFTLDDSGSDFDITLSGPPLRIGVNAAQPLSMALHELATNAAKYGSLSVAKGRLTVSWTVVDAEVHIRWREQGGPLVTDPAETKGFGSRLIGIVFEGQIGGRIQKRWDPEGLICDMVLPASALTAADAASGHVFPTGCHQADRAGSA